MLHETENNESSRYQWVLIISLPPKWFCLDLFCVTLYKTLFNPLHQSSQTPLRFVRWIVWNDRLLTAKCLQPDNLWRKCWRSPNERVRLSILITCFLNLLLSNLLVFLILLSVLWSSYKYSIHSFICETNTFDFCCCAVSSKVFFTTPVSAKFPSLSVCRVFSSLLLPNQPEFQLGPMIRGYSHNNRLFRCSQTCRAQPTWPFPVVWLRQSLLALHVPKVRKGVTHFPVFHS